MEKRANNVRVFDDADRLQALSRCVRKSQQTTTVAAKTRRRGEGRPSPHKKGREGTQPCRGALRDLGVNQDMHQNQSWTDQHSRLQ